MTKERIAKVIARAGVCSRRHAEEWILQGRVILNGEALTSPACTVGPDDHILVDGKPLPQKEPTRVWRFYKPVGYITTSHDPQGRPTLFSLLPKDLPRVISVGRLDINSEGLIVLTNNGELSRRLELPSTAWIRGYRVRVFGLVDPRQLVALGEGVTIDGVQYKPIKATLDMQKNRNAWITFKLTEGKNREIRRICEHLGLQVNRLIRTSFGPFLLGDLKEGEAREVSEKQLKDFLGKMLS